MPSRGSVVLTLIIGLAVLASGTASANLDDTAQAARARAADYARRYGATDPIFKTTAKGLIALECWAAPPDRWSKETAMAFGLELVPTRLQSSTPAALPDDDANETYRFEDGTTLILQNAGGEYIGVEVRAKGYKGPEC